MNTDRQSLRLQVKYCGGCNPDIDRKAVVDGLVRLLKSSSIPVEMATGDGPVDLLLIVNGCSHACREEEMADGAMPCRWISVQGKRLRHQEVPEDRIPRMLLDRVKSMLG